MSPTGLSPCLVWLPNQFGYHFCGNGLVRFRSPLLAESFPFLGVLRCFSSPGSLPYPMCSDTVTRVYTPCGFPHSDIPGSSRLHTPDRSLSQCITSFIGARCQGIHHMLLVALYNNAAHCTPHLRCRELGTLHVCLFTTYFLMSHPQVLTRACAF